MFKLFKRAGTKSVRERPSATPTRIYVVSGTCTRPYAKPPYSTDLRTYGVALKPGITDDEYEKAKANLKAFINRDDAITFAYHCNLDSVMCPVFDRVGEEWKYNKLETGRMAEDIN